MSFTIHICDNVQDGDIIVYKLCKSIPHRALILILAKNDLFMNFISTYASLSIHEVKKGFYSGPDGLVKGMWELFLSILNPCWSSIILCCDKVYYGRAS